MLKKLDKEFVAVIAIAVIVFIGFAAFGASQFSTNGWGKTMKSLVEDGYQTSAKK